jgi:hypothetical protein
VLTVLAVSQAVGLAGSWRWRVPHSSLPDDPTGVRARTRNSRHMSEASTTRPRSPLDIGVMLALATLSVAALAGLVAVLEAESVASGFARGFGIAFAILLAGGTIAAAVACLARRRAEIVALAAIAAAGLSIDLLILAVWLDIDDEGYGKLTGLTFVWSFFALVVLGLVLAVGSPQGLARALSLGTIGIAVVGALVSTWLILTAGDGDVGIVAGGAPVPFTGAAEDELLRLLGASLVLLAALWFATLAASRLESPLPADA